MLHGLRPVLSSLDPDLVVEEVIATHEDLREFCIGFGLLRCLPEFVFLGVDLVDLELNDFIDVPVGSDDCRFLNRLILQYHRADRGDDPRHCVVALNRRYRVDVTLDAVGFELLLVVGDCSGLVVAPVLIPDGSLVLEVAVKLCRAHGG